MINIAYDILLKKTLLKRTLSINQSYFSWVYFISIIRWTTVFMQNKTYILTNFPRLKIDLWQISERCIKVWQNKNSQCINFLIQHYPISLISLKNHTLWYLFRSRYCLIFYLGGGHHWFFFSRNFLKQVLTSLSIDFLLDLQNYSFSKVQKYHQKLIQVRLDPIHN